MAMGTRDDQKEEGHWGEKRMSKMYSGCEYTYTVLSSKVQRSQVLYKVGTMKTIKHMLSRALQTDM